jgi:hypothetical protein
MAGLLVSTVAFTDEPPLPPAPQRFWSPDRQVAAYTSPGSDTRVVSAASGKELWRIPGWHRQLHLSNDGAHAAAVYDGVNLIPLDAKPDLVLVTIWTRGKKSGEVALTQIAPSTASLQRTVSHYAWGTVIGFDEVNHVVIERIDGRRFRFTIEGKSW